nr:putative alpha amylase [uncultured Mediterranean phage uvMED]
MSTIKAANVQNTGSGAPVFKNSSGTEIGQLAKAWVNFNGTGTVAIRDDFNVSSITDNGTGDYKLNFTTAMSDTNYALVGSAGQTGSTGNADALVSNGRNNNYSDLRSTTFGTIRTFTVSGSSEDMQIINVVVLGA